MSTVSPQQFQQTKDRIRTLVQEIGQLSKQDLDDEAYYAEIVQRVVAALAAVGGAVWTAGEGGRARLAYQMNVPEKLLDRESEEGTRHYALLDQSLRGGQPSLVPPLSGTEDKKGPGNPTRCLLLMGPLKADDHVEGVLEIFQRPNTAVEAQRGYLQFVLQICDMVGEWLKSRRLRHFSDRQSLWSQADEFSSLVHESLDLQQTAFTIANEGRRLIECDRVSVAVGDGNYCYIEAVSGQDTPDNRSNVITMLSDVATRVVATGEPLWFEGETEDLPPQIEEALRTYVDETHTKAIAVLPLHRPMDTTNLTEEEKSKEKMLGPVIGAVIIEQIEDTRPREILEARADQVRRHSALALANSLDHTNIFLMPLWRWIGNQLWIFNMRTLPKTIAVIALVVVALFALWLVPWNLWVEGDGRLRAAFANVYAAQNGQVVDVKVKHGDRVTKGQVLLQMRDTDMEVKYADTLGQLNTTIERIYAIGTQMNSSELKAGERDKLAAEKSELLERQRGLERQKALMEQKREELTVKSPLDGIVTTWNINENLLQRPVQRGQQLLTVADTTSPWELEVIVPETNLGHIHNAQKRFEKTGLEVSYVLQTEPSTYYHGTLREVEEAAQVYDDNVHGAKAHVILDPDNLPTDPRPNATAKTKINCGSHSVGYVLFHKAIEWVQTYVFF